MAVRTSASQTAARQRARALAAAFQQREATLLALAGDYFLAAETLDQIAERAERDMQKIRDRADADGAAARADATAAMVKMLDAGATRPEVAERLGISTRDVPRPEKNLTPTDREQGGVEDDHSVSTDDVVTDTDEHHGAVEDGAADHDAESSSDVGGSTSEPSDAVANLASSDSNSGADVHIGAGEEHVAPAWSYQP